MTYKGKDMEICSSPCGSVTLSVLIPRYYEKKTLERLI